jgi:hypothetical protein
VKRIATVCVVVVFGGVGLAAGLVLGGGNGWDADSVPEQQVIVRAEDGEARGYSVAEAASRIESLEALLRRRDQRYTSRAASEDEEEEEVEEQPDPFRNEPPFVHPEGRPYTPDELRALARGAEDPDTRARAIRALRRVDSDEARETLQAILEDGETSDELRMIAAQVLARPPHRDHLPEELIEAFEGEENADIRRVLARGVATLRARGAWMREISALLQEETDPEARGALFHAVARTSRDPAARAELLAVATSPNADAAERRWALAALTRGRPDAAMVQELRPLLQAADPGVRAQALRILTADRGMPLATLRAGLSDADAAVRATALNGGLRHLGRLGRNKGSSKPAYKQTVGAVVRMATSDPDPAVRRAAVNNSWALPKKPRAALLEAGRKDDDVAVRLSAYAASPRNVAVTATRDFVGALSSPDASLRGFAYNQLRRLHGIRVPYQPNWNPKSRSAAIEDIERELAQSGK